MGAYNPPTDADARNRVTVTSTRPLGALGRIVAVREKQKAAGYTPFYDAQNDIVAITGTIHSNLFDALTSQGEERKHALAKIGALAFAAIEREEEIERAREAARLARELAAPPEGEAQP